MIQDFAGTRYDLADIFSAAHCNPARVHKAETLKKANEALELPNVCLARIRQPLGYVGGYWNMDPHVVFSVTAGQLPAVIRAIECMREFFAARITDERFSERVRKDMRVFLGRSSAWVRANQFDDLVVSLCIPEDVECVSSTHYDLN
ncbi:hypothetical protein GGH12_000975 [Coemansia sp. RSA 1822]|nr:hypothetical protein LPJ76_003057 [Coemansia sp. RSA 638]KAJ2124193.1 hypothetical protein IW147_001931 [Coemansia sp. RSA 720]KAJ2543064.1 hypothetical protein GGF49_002388 [Coemansia sp. RSA 1853]KAJ2566245.1 hypothetical protein GGH12_000975 [Coemansia sp. RSA 1822]